MKAFPQYAGFPLFFSADKRLIIEAAYRADSPDSPGPKPDTEDVERDELVCTIAASLCLMMLHCVRLNADKLKIKIPKDSLDVVMAVLRKLRAERRR